MTKRASNTVLQDNFLISYIESNGNVSAAAEKVGMERRTFYHWMKNDPEFVKRLEETKQQFADKLFNVAMDFAFQGDTTLIIFLLKSLQRERYDDGFIRQKYAIEKGLQPQVEQFVPIRAVLVREPSPGEIAPGKKSEVEHSVN